MATPRLILTLLAVMALQPAYAAAGSSQGSFVVRLVVTSQCSTQYTLFGPQAMGPVSVVCSPGSTPFMTFSDIISNVAGGRGGAGASGAASDASDEQDDSGAPAFSIGSAETSPLASKSTALSGQKTRIVHVTF